MRITQINVWVADRPLETTRDGLPYSDVWHIDKDCSHFAGPGRVRTPPPRRATRHEVIYGRPCRDCSAILLQWREETYTGNAQAVA